MKSIMKDTLDYKLQPENNGTVWKCENVAEV
jgi:hypothetical protein